MMMIACISITALVTFVHTSGQGSVRTAGIDLLASALVRTMAAGAPRHVPPGPTMPQKFFDDAEQYPVPTSPWKCGDYPENGRVHIDLYVSGYAYGGARVNNTTGEPRVLDQNIADHSQLVYR